VAVAVAVVIATLDTSRVETLSYTGQNSSSSCSCVYGILVDSWKKGEREVKGGLGMRKGRDCASVSEGDINPLSLPSLLSTRAVMREVLKVWAGAGTRPGRDIKPPLSTPSSPSTRAVMREMLKVWAGAWEGYKAPSSLLLYPVSERTRS